MKKNGVIIVVGVVFLAIGYVLGLFLPVTGGTGSVSMNTEIDTFAYSYGYDMGGFVKGNIEKMGDTTDFNHALFIKGVKAGLVQDESVMPSSETGMHIQSYLMKKSQEIQARESQVAEENLAAGQKFLEENKGKEGVKTTKSGLEYKILTEGDGPSPGPNDTVVVQYTGKLIDGTVFDSSIERGEPATFQVGGVIPGWTEALQMMKVGSKWQIYIPSELAYGSRKRGEKIPANSVLIFDVELLAIK